MNNLSSKKKEKEKKKKRKEKKTTNVVVTVEELWLLLIKLLASNIENGLRTRKDIPLDKRWTLSQSGVCKLSSECPFVHVFHFRHCDYFFPSI